MKFQIIFLKFVSSNIAGFTAIQLRCAGFGASSLREGGYGILDVSAAGFDHRKLRLGGFSARELLFDLHLNEKQLKEAGFSCDDLKV